MNIANQFKGLPMGDLIGGPLKAACEANVLMAQATSNFINDVGFIKDKEGKPTTPRMVDFSYEKPSKDAEGNPTIDLVNVKVPILAIVPIPNLQVNNVDVTFDMEVKSSSTSTEKSSKEIGGELTASASWGWGKAEVKISGSVASSKENTRKSDKSAKYHVEINAMNFGLPEGLARVLDMMNQAAQPRQIQQYKMDGKGEKTGDPTQVDSDGTPIRDSNKTVNNPNASGNTDPDQV